MERAKGERYITDDGDDRQTAMERLAKACKGFVEYTERCEVCVAVFNKLRAILNDDQLLLLMDYEESLALKEEVVGAIVNHMFKNI